MWQQFGGVAARFLAFKDRQSASRCLQPKQLAKKLLRFDTDRVYPGPGNRPGKAPHFDTAIGHFHSTNSEAHQMQDGEKSDKP